MMDTNDILKIAEECGLTDFYVYGRLETKEEILQQFAQRIAQIEREACVKLCEYNRDDWFRGLGRYEFMAEGADYCADAIRARGEK